MNCLFFSWIDAEKPSPVFPGTARKRSVQCHQSRGLDKERCFKLAGLAATCHACDLQRHCAFCIPSLADARLRSKVELGEIYASRRYFHAKFFSQGQLRSGGCVEEISKIDCLLGLTRFSN